MEKTKKKSNAGRKPEAGKARNHLLTIKLTDEEIAAIDKIANKINIPRTTLARNLLLTGLEDAKLLNRIGILKGLKKLDDFKKALKKEKTDTEPKLAI